MRALRLYAPYDLRLEEVSEPVLVDGWVLIRSLYVGVCGTDKAIYTGSYVLPRYPITLGHEVAGVVVDGPRDLIGCRVTCEINFPCCKCEMCRLGLYTHCPYRRTLGLTFDGGLADYFTAPLSSIHLIDDLNPILGVFVEPLAAVINAVKFELITRPVKVAVIGSGNLAYLTTQVLMLMGLDPVVIARRDSPKVKYFEELNAEIVYVDEVEEYVEKRTSMGLGFNLTFEATGSNEGLNLAVKITRPRGVVHVKSTPGGLAQFNQTLAVVKELKIICSRCGNFRDFEYAIKLLRSGLVKPVVTSILKLSDSSRIFERALNRCELKVVVEI